MKLIALLMGAFAAPLLCYAQSAQPDTLKLETKNGQQIILIGKDLNSFNTIKTDSIIQKALLSVKDSLGDGKTGVQQKASKNDQYTFILKKKQLFRLESSISAGLIRNNLSPFMGLNLNFAPQRQDYYLRNVAGSYSYLALGLNAFYFFDKDIDGNYVTSTNLFLEGSLGGRVNNSQKRQSNFAELALGVGYLIRNRGDYFQQNTFKVFGSVLYNNSILRFKPEIYITDNFRKVFPGISISASWAK